MTPIYPNLLWYPGRDQLVVWVRWVSLEQPPTPDAPPNQGVRVALLLNRNPVLGPTIVWRRDLADGPVALAANRERVEAVMAKAAGGALDLQLVIHGSVAHAPYAALAHVRDYPGAAIERADLPSTPVLQVQPSTPADRWHVAGQASLRVLVDRLVAPVLSPGHRQVS